MSSSPALHRRSAFLRGYRFLPHRILNRGVAQITAAKRPRWLVDRAIELWTRVEQIELDDFEARRFDSLDDFFLRRLRDGARPLGSGFVAPADGKLVAYGEIAPDRPLIVKAQRLSLERLVNAGHYDLDLAKYAGGRYAVIFLTPRGYHRVHMPVDGELIDVRWIAGRYFPQNEDALEHIPRIYERNERAVLRCRSETGTEFLLVLVGASLIGGIHLEGIARRDWARTRPVPLGFRVSLGDELGHFAFGSTVVALLPRGFAEPDPLGVASEIRMGETLFRIR
jgi:phosphatidylserine decarboxylase